MLIRHRILSTARLPRRRAPRDNMRRPQTAAAGREAASGAAARRAASARAAPAALAARSAGRGTSTRGAAQRDPPPHWTRCARCSRLRQACATGVGGLELEPAERCACGAEPAAGSCYGTPHGRPPARLRGDGHMAREAGGAGAAQALPTPTWRLAAHPRSAAPAPGGESDGGEGEEGCSDAAYLRRHAGMAGLFTAVELSPLVRAAAKGSAAARAQPRRASRAPCSPRLARSPLPPRTMRASAVRSTAGSASEPSRGRCAGGLFAAAPQSSGSNERPDACPE